MASDSDRLEAIVHLIDLIDSDLSGFDKQGFDDQQILVDATAYRLMHVGENATRLSEGLKSRYPDLPWASIASARNFMAHDYFGLNLGTLWVTVRDHLAPLRAMCIAELAAEKNQGE